MMIVTMKKILKTMVWKMNRAHLMKMREVPHKINMTVTLLTMVELKLREKNIKSVKVVLNCIPLKKNTTLSHNKHRLQRKKKIMTQTFTKRLNQHLDSKEGGSNSTLNRGSTTYQKDLSSHKKFSQIYLLIKEKVLSGSMLFTEITQGVCQEMIWVWGRQFRSQLIWKAFLKEKLSKRCLQQSQLV